MRNLKRILFSLAVLSSAMLFIGCSKDDEAPQKTLTPSEILSSVAWETTNAKNNSGEDVALTDPNVSNFVGFAYFKMDGTYTMFNLDDSPKLHGDWSVSEDGKTRTITGEDAEGNVLFTRIVEITVLSKEEFTYRIYPNEEDKTVYFDIIHTPTSHAEPE